MWWWWLEQTESNFKGFNISELNTDEAWLNISSSNDKPVWMYILSEDCNRCSFKRFLDVPLLPNHSYKATVNTQHGLTFRLRTSGEFNYTPSINDSFRICDIKGDLGEFGVYSISIHNDAQTYPQCSLTNDLEPVNTYLPILVTLVFWLFVGFILKYCNKYWNSVTTSFRQICSERFALFFTSHLNRPEDETRILSEAGDTTEPEIDKKDVSEDISAQRKAGKRKKKTAINSTTQVESVAPDGNEAIRPTSSRSIDSTTQSRQELCTPRKERLKSLDAFRGLCILIMIFADDGGGGYYFFQHSTWDGLYVADLAFPWFLWICGTSIPFSMQSRLSTGTFKKTIFKEVFIRSLKLVLLGIMVNTSTRATAAQLENLRLPGVLQRFGICYLIGSTLLMLFYDPRNAYNSNDPNTDQNHRWKLFKDFKCTIIPWIVVVIFVGIHTTIIFLLPVPGCPSGYLGPAGLHNGSAFPPHCVGGATGYIDRLIFGTKHIHNRPTSQQVYGSGAFDPEGTLGLLTSVLHVWLGIQAGIIVLTYQNAKQRVVRLLTWSLICGVGGFILCNGFSNSGWVPVNKNLWSLSFVLVTSSAALALLAILYLVIDVHQKWSGTPLVETGRNSILLYLGHEVCHAMLPWHFSYGKMILHTSKLMETSWGTALWIAVAVYLHDRQLFFVV